MPLASLSIELDGDDANYCPGDVVTGSVVVSPTRAHECNRLIVDLRWIVDGAFSDDISDPVVIENIGDGDWDPANPPEYPFSLRLPARRRVRHRHFHHVCGNDSHPPGSVALLRGNG